MLTFVLFRFVSFRFTVYIYQWFPGVFDETRELVEIESTHRKKNEVIG